MEKLSKALNALRVFLEEQYGVPGDLLDAYDAIYETEMELCYEEQKQQREKQEQMLDNWMNGQTTPDSIPEPPEPPPVEREREPAKPGGFVGQGAKDKRRIYEKLRAVRYKAADLVEQSGGCLTFEDVMTAKEAGKLPLQTWQLIELAMGLIDKEREHEGSSDHSHRDRPDAGAAAEDGADAGAP